MWGFLSALISGALMSIQGVFNTNVTKQTSLWVSTGWVQFSAFLVCVAAWLFTGRESIGALGQFGASAVSYAHCDLPACSGLSHRTDGTFWSGKSGFSVEKAVWNADLHCRCGHFQMEIEIKVL